jgi:hypothetical protein
LKNGRLDTIFFADAKSSCFVAAWTKVILNKSMTHRDEPALFRLGAPRRPTMVMTRTLDLIAVCAACAMVASAVVAAW